MDDFQQEAGQPAGDDGGELAALQMQAAALDGEQAATSPQAMIAAQEEMAVLTLAEENAAGVRGVLALAVPLLGEMYPSIKAIYTDDVQGRVAAALGPVLAKYGINVGQVGGAYREEIGALFVCVPIAMATYKGITADVAARQGPQAAQVAQSDAEAQKTPPRPAGSLKPGDYGYQEAGSA